DEVRPVEQSLNTLVSQGGSIKINHQQKLQTSIPFSSIYTIMYYTSDPLDYCINRCVLCHMVFKKSKNLENHMHKVNTDRIEEYERKGREAFRCAEINYRTTPEPEDPRQAPAVVADHRMCSGIATCRVETSRESTPDLERMNPAQVR